MNSTLQVALILVGCFLTGSFPTGVLISKRRYGIDVREMGSGNIGATNITRTFGWFAGFLTFLVDFLKGLVPTWILFKYMPEPPWLLSMGAACLVLGHCYSVFLKFRGGKGVATSFGCVAVVAPWGALFAGLAYAILLAVTRISALGSLAGIFVILIYSLAGSLGEYEKLLLYGISFVVVVRHHRNIRRLLSGTEKGKASHEKK